MLKLIDALEGGNFKQCFDCMHNKENDSHCAWGVAEVLFGETRSGFLAPIPLREWLWSDPNEPKGKNIYARELLNLTLLNDFDRLSFSAIAHELKKLL